MKKLISLMLALMLVFSLATVAMAAEGDKYTGTEDAAATIQKIYHVNNGKSPNTNFSYTITFEKYVNNEGTEVAITDAPALTVAPTRTLAKKDAATTAYTEDLTINLSAFATEELGVYYYTITEDIPAEAANKVAGVNYDASPLLLKVTVYRDESSNTHYVGALRIDNEQGLKDNTFTNSYDAGQLSVKKEITGNAADMSKQFKFTVTFNHAGKFLSEINSTFAQNDGNDYPAPSVSPDGMTYTFYLGDGETATFANLPAGTTYSVTEDSVKYTSDGGKFSDSAKTIAAGDTDSVTFTNTLHNPVDTGITLDSLPFVLILAVCAGAVVLFVIKRRNSVEF